MGTRLRPITYEIPKPLVTVKKKPIVNHLIELFHKHGFNEIALLVNRDHEEDFKRWRKAWEDDLPTREITTFFEETPRGTFGGMELVKSWLGGEKFILSNGDELKDFDLTALKNFHDTHKPVGTIALVEVTNPQEYGVPVLNDHHVVEFLEKPQNPPSNYINSGLYMLEPTIFEYADFSKPTLMIEKDIFPALAAAQKLAGFKVKNGRWYDCGTLERWERAMQEW